MKEKYISESTLSLTKYPQYSPITSVSEAQQIKTKDGREYTLLGQSEKTYTPLQRTCLAIRTLAFTLFSAGLALIFASIREDWKASLTGKRMVLIYTSDKSKEEGGPPNATPTAQTASLLQNLSQPSNTPSPSGFPDPSTVQSPLTPVPVPTQPNSGSKSLPNGSGGANDGSGSAKAVSPPPSSNTNGSGGKSTGGSGIASPSNTDTSRSQTKPDALPNSKVPGPSTSTPLQSEIKPITPGEICHEFLQAQQLLTSAFATAPIKTIEVAQAISLLKAAQTKKSADAFLLLALLINNEEIATQIYLTPDAIDINKNVDAEEVKLVGEQQAKNSAIKKVRDLIRQETYRLHTEGALLGNSYCAYMVGMMDYELLEERPDLTSNCSKYLKQALEGNLQQFEEETPDYLKCFAEDPTEDFDIEKVRGIQKYAEALALPNENQEQKIQLLKESFFQHKNKLALIALMCLLGKNLNSHLSQEEQKAALKAFQKLHSPLPNLNPAQQKSRAPIYFALANFYKMLGDNKAVINCYETAATLCNHIPSLNNLGDIVKHRSIEQALPFYQKSASLCNPYGNYQLGHSNYLLANNIEQQIRSLSTDPTPLLSEQAKAIQKAYAHTRFVLLKDENNVDAQFLLADLYLTFPEQMKMIAGLSSQDETYNSAWKIFSKFETYSYAQYALGYMCEHRKGPMATAATAQADEWYQKAAIAGDFHAIEALVRREQTDILNAFITNKDVRALRMIAQADVDHPLKWFEHAANFGDVEAMVIAANLNWTNYDADTTQKALRSKALDFWRQAANLGSLDAMNALKEHTEPKEFQTYCVEGDQQKNPYWTYEHIMLYAGGDYSSKMYTQEEAQGFIDKAIQLKAQHPEIIQERCTPESTHELQPKGLIKEVICYELLVALGVDFFQAALGEALIRYTLDEIHRGRSTPLIENMTDRAFNYLLQTIKQGNSWAAERILTQLVYSGYVFNKYPSQITSYSDQVKNFTFQSNPDLIAQEEQLTKLLEKSLVDVRNILYPDSSNPSNVDPQEIINNLHTYLQMKLTLENENE